MVKFFIYTVFALSLSGCASGPNIKEQTKLDLTLNADINQNSNNKGQPSPLMVRVYELKSEALFEATDFFTLQSNDTNILAADILLREEFLMRPGESRNIRRKSNPETIAIGVIAAYQDLGQSVWRAVYKMPPAPEAVWYRTMVPANRSKLNISLGARAVRITEIE
jgi:type VI secretion system protein VasD